ncbi:hypothetical protein ACFT7S_34930 [Streptomyces sp. NPDC057136]
MDWFMAAMVGAAGGASMEAIDIIKAINLAVSVGVAGRLSEFV